MVRLARILPSLTLAVCFAAPLCPSLARADDMPAAAPDAPAQAAPAPAAPAPAAPAAPDATAPAAPAPAAEAAPALSDEQKSLIDLVDTFWHYGKVGRYDLAADAGGKVLTASNDSPAILAAFEVVAANHKDSIDTWMLKWRALPVPTVNAAASVNPAVQADKDAIEKMKDISTKLDEKINEGYEARRTSPEYIRETIVSMSKGERGYDNNFPRLAKSGEFSVKILVDILRNPNDRALNNTVRRALKDLGRKAIGPLLAATEMKDAVTLVDVISIIGDIGYDTAIPYLSRIANAKDQPAAVRSAANAALIHMGAGDFKMMDPASQFYELAEKFYYGNASVTPSPEKNSYLWFWSETDGLDKVDVPSSIFNDVMSMRAAEYVLKLDPTRGQAVSLWLDADTKREVDLPAGSEDPSHKGSPDAHYYSVSAGVKYLNEALSRALKDRNSGVALKLTQALQDIVGGSNMGGPNEPITQALNFPNRLVRYEAAFALAESLPTKPFASSDRVVPLLAEALSQTSKPNVLVIAPAADGMVNAIQDAVQGLGFPVVSSTDVATGVNNAISLPAVDVVVISENSDVQHLMELVSQSPRLEGASILVLTKVSNNPYAVRAASDPLINAAVMPSKENLGTTLKAEIDKARVHAGGVPLTDAQAAEYGLRASDLLEKLAISRDQILDLTVVETPMIAALADSRPEIAKAVGNALAMFKSKTAQNGLASRALDETTPPDVRVSLFKSLANNAKFFGNNLDSQNVAALEKTVTDNKNADVRGAAASARGALNLPSSEARTLIVGQSKV